MNSASYSQVPINDDEDDSNTNPIVNSSEIEEISRSSEVLGKTVTCLRHDRLIPISRPPSSPRDSIYGLLFVAHFIIISIVSMTLNSSNNYISTKLTGNWDSVLLVSALFGSFFGVLLFFSLKVGEFREKLLSYGLTAAIIVQIALGNSLILIQSKYYILGVFFLLSAIQGAFSYQRIAENLPSMSAFMDMTLDIGKCYGLYLFFVCVFITCLQTCMLLWWSVFLLYYLSREDIASFDFTIVIMALSFYWIVQFGRALVSFVVGGAMAFYFVKPDEEELKEADRMSLYMKCALSTSFGTIAKGALLCPIAEEMRRWLEWSLDRPPLRCCSLKCMVSRLLLPFSSFIKNHDRISLSLCALYGRTLRYSSESFLSNHPLAPFIVERNSTHEVLTSCSISLSGLVAVIFGIFMETKDTSSWVLLFLIVALILYGGVSLGCYVYSGSIDALIVSFFLRPEKFSEDNQILYLRLCRYSEDIN